MAVDPAQEMPTLVPEQVTRAVNRYWAARADGRVISVDEALETSPGTAEWQQTRATAIQLIATQAATLAGSLETTEVEKQTIASVVGATVAAGIADGGPLPAIEGYDLVSCLGRGGMGAVFEGYQRSTGRRVAVKFMLDRLGASEAARKRFEREVEVVARLQHPGIVSVLDSGVRKGQYYYVMEFVEGKALDEAVKPGACGVRDALDIIARVCDAMDYAHQRGVLHRDLKPSNTLISASLTPHLLDFGLAKVFDPAESDGGTHGRMGLTVSGPGQLLGTLAYMSPEQARGRHDETSVRTDVYSLGAIAYELVTGKLPCAMSGSLAEALARITVQPPPAPSSLRKGLSRDLDAVLLKALEKSPERRYATAGEFAADLRRHLAGEPVVARRVGAAGRAARWVRRNQAISGVIAAALVAIAVVSAVLVTRIVRERDLARESFSTLRNILEKTHPDPQRYPGGVTVVDLLDNATEQMNKSPPEMEVAEAEIRDIIGGVYRRFKQFEKAKASQRRVLEIREKQAHGDSPELADALHQLAATLWFDRRYNEAERLYQRSLDMRRRLFKGDHAAVATSLHHLAACEMRMGKLEASRDLYEQALTMRKALYGSESEEVAQVLNGLASVEMESGRYDRAEALFSQALETMRRVRGEYADGTAAVSQNLGDCFMHQAEVARCAGRNQDATALTMRAEALFQRALEIRLRMFPNGHQDPAKTLSALARVAVSRGDAQRGIELASRSLAMMRGVAALDDPDVAGCLESLGLAQIAGDHPRAAVDSLTGAMAIALKTEPQVPMQVARLRHELGRALLADGALAEAEPLLREALASFRAERGDDAYQTRNAAADLLVLYTARGDTAAAAALSPLVGPK